MMMRAKKGTGTFICGFATWINASVPFLALGLRVVMVAVACLAHAHAVMADSFAISSVAFSDGGLIPRRYTCQGDDISPPLAWSGVPAGTKSLALIMDDPDAPDPQRPQRTWSHWVLYNIPPETKELPEGAAVLPVGAREGRNDFKRTGYGGPCPPKGRHRYFHKLFALDTVLEDLGGPTKAELEQAIEGHVLGKAELVGLFQK